MAYNALTYLAYFLFGVYLVWCLTPEKMRPFVLLAASIVFYLSFSVLYSAFIVGTIGVAWLCGLGIEKTKDRASKAKNTLSGAEKKQKLAACKRQKKWITALGTAFFVLALLWRKYSAFLAAMVNELLKRMPTPCALPILHYIMPLGISFYTLMAISYVVDVYRGTCHAGKLWQVALYLLFWPHIVEGPFDRYPALQDTLFSSQQRPNYQNLTFGVQRILWGMIKKVVIADRAAQYVNTAFSSYQDYQGSQIILFALLYTLQLYAEFSGCMDIVLGSAELFGIPLAENFRQPFFAKSAGEFWRRWHISLGAWLREYVFQPFIMSKASLKLGTTCRKHFGAAVSRVVPVWIGLIVTWLLIGLWHGAAWIYVVYGLYYCVLQLLGQILGWVLEKYFPRFCAWKTHHRGYGLFQMLRTFVLVNIGMLMFRAESLTVAVAMMKAIFYQSAGTLKISWQDAAVLAVGAVVILLVDVFHEKGIHLRSTIASWKLPIRWAIYCAAVLCLVIFGAYGYNYEPTAFIYAQF